MVTVGYGDMSPQNPQEMCLSIFTILIACGVFAYSINSVGQVFQQIYQSEEEANKNLRIINRYMSKKQVSKGLQYQIRQYLEYYWRESSTQNQEVEDQIIRQLSTVLQETLLFEANKMILKDNPMFSNNFSSQFLRKIIPLIKEYRSTPEEVIFLTGQINNKDDASIYFIEKGTVELYYCEQNNVENNILNQKKTKLIKEQNIIKNENNFQTSTDSNKRKIVPIKQLKKGESFGAFSFFTGQPRTLSARALDFSTLLVITRKDFIQLLQQFPLDYQKFCDLRDEMLLSTTINAQSQGRGIGQCQRIYISCLSCGNSSHNISDCPLLHYQPDRHRIFKIFNHPIFQERINGLQRRRRTKLNTLLNSGFFSVMLSNFRGSQFDEIEDYCQQVVDISKYELKKNYHMDQKEITNIINYDSSSDEEDYFEEDNNFNNKLVNIQKQQQQQQSKQKNVQLDKRKSNIEKFKQQYSTEKISENSQSEESDDYSNKDQGDSKILNNQKSSLTNRSNSCDEDNDNQSSKSEKQYNEILQCSSKKSNKSSNSIKSQQNKSNNKQSPSLNSQQSNFTIQSESIHLTPLKHQRKSKTDNQEQLQDNQLLTIEQLNKNNQIEENKIRLSQGSVKLQNILFNNTFKEVTDNVRNKQNTNSSINNDISDNIGHQINHKNNIQKSSKKEHSDIKAENEMQNQNKKLQNQSIKQKLHSKKSHSYTNLQNTGNIEQNLKSRKSILKKQSLKSFTKSFSQQQFMQQNNNLNSENQVRESLKSISIKQQNPKRHRETIFVVKKDDFIIDDKFSNQVKLMQKQDQDNLLQIHSEFEFNQQFETMKNFEVYQPWNNAQFIIDSIGLTKQEIDFNRQQVIANSIDKLGLIAILNKYKSITIQNKSLQSMANDMNQQSNSQINNKKKSQDLKIKKKTTVKYQKGISNQNVHNENNSQGTQRLIVQSRRNQLLQKEKTEQIQLNREATINKNISPFIQNQPIEKSRFAQSIQNNYLKSLLLNNNGEENNSQFININQSSKIINQSSSSKVNSLILNQNNNNNNHSYPVSDASIQDNQIQVHFKKDTINKLIDQENNNNNISFSNDISQNQLFNSISQGQQLENLNGENLLENQIDNNNSVGEIYLQEVKHMIVGQFRGSNHMAQDKTNLQDVKEN